MLDHTTYDQNGYAPDLNLIGTRWVHAVRGTVYEIVDFVWNCDNDTWSVLYSGLHVSVPLKFSRAAKDFFGVNKYDYPRFRPY